GWVHKGTKYTYLDRTSTPVNGLRRITISDLSSSTPGMVRVQIKAAAGGYAVGPTFAPMNVILVLGGVSSATAGLCSETQFLPDDCAYDQGNNQLIRCASQ